MKVKAISIIRMATDKVSTPIDWSKQEAFSKELLLDLSNGWEIISAVSWGGADIAGVDYIIVFKNKLHL